MEEFWQVYGISWQGKVAKRSGRPIKCGHQHQTEQECMPCLEKMKKEKPGNCYDYQPVHLVLAIATKEK